MTRRNVAAAGCGDDVKPFVKEEADMRIVMPERVLVRTPVVVFVVALATLTAPVLWVAGAASPQPPDPGSLVAVSMQSEVGVVLDELDQPAMLADAVVTSVPTAVTFTCPSPRTGGAAEPGGTYSIYTAPVFPDDSAAAVTRT